MKRKMISAFKAKSKSFTHSPAYFISVHSNQPIRLLEYINGREKKYDFNPQNYDVTIQALLQKRWTQKREIAPKIYIIEKSAGIEETLLQQRLINMKKNLPIESLKKMAEMRKVSTSYIISVLCEDHFKSMMDEYLSKILVSGRVVSLAHREDYEETKAKVMTLYHKFFYGDELSNMERLIERQYLVKKQEKYFRFKENVKKNLRFKSIWTFTDQRRLESFQNWHFRSSRLYDDFRPIFEKVNLDALLKFKDEVESSNENTSTLDNIILALSKRLNNGNSKEKIEWMAEILVTRTYIYTQSMELIKVLGIPPDFHIEACLLNIHFWLILSRLSQFKQSDASLLFKKTEENINDFLEDKYGKIMLKRKQDFIDDIKKYMQSCRETLSEHFAKNAKDPYQKLDRIIWSTVFMEKLPADSDEVLILSEYVIKHFEYVNSLPLERFFECDIQWDVLRVSIDFKKGFKKQPNESEAMSSEQPTPLPIDIEAKESRRMKFWDKYVYNMAYVLRKYLTLKTYDYYSSVEEKSKEKSKTESKYIWKPVKNVEESEAFDETYLKKLREKRN